MAPRLSPVVALFLSLLLLLVLLPTTPIAAQSASYSTVCEGTLKSLVTVDPTRTNVQVMRNNGNKQVQVMRNNGNKQVQVFWQSKTAGGVYTAFVDPALNGTGLSTPVMVSNSSAIIDFKVATAVNQRMMVVVMSLRSDLTQPGGLRSRFSTDAGVTWQAVDVDGTTKAVDGQLVPNAASSPQNAYDLLFTGNEFVVVSWNNAPFVIQQPNVAYFNSSNQWNTWGFDPIHITYDGKGVVLNQTDFLTQPYGNGASTATTPLRADYVGQTSISVATDGSTIIMGYELEDGTLEFQSQTVGNVNSIFKKLANATTVQKRNNFEIAASGARGVFLVVSSYSPIGTTTANLMSELSVNGGLTWGKARVIKVGTPQVIAQDQLLRYTVSYTNQWVVAFSDATPGYSSKAGANVLISSSFNGFFWATPELLYDLQGNSSRVLSMMSLSSSSYFVGFEASNGLGTAMCPLFNVENALYTSGASNPLGKVSSIVLGTVVAVVGALMI